MRSPSGLFYSLLWRNSRHCSPSWIPGPNVIPDPRGKPPPPPLGSVAVLCPPAIHCYPRRYHHKPTRRLLRLPSLLQERKRLVKVRTTCHCVTRLSTRETHHIRPVSSGGSLSRRLPLSFQCRRHWGAHDCGRLTLTSCCNSFSTSETSGFGAGSSAVLSKRRSMSSN